ncbi:glycosyltransferase family 4 protein [Candidatus Microgenomates bacterium]|nr:glycosyltransferase family 4 protein [Candidatus Microgenomates bacterium]
MGKAAIKNPYLDTLGGGERYTLSVAIVLAGMGYEVDIAWKEKSILQRLSNRFGMTLPKSIKIVNEINRGENYDVCFWVSDGSIPTLRAKRNFLHFQVPFHGVNGKSLLNKMKLFRIEKIICNSNFTKRIIDREYGVESVVVYPPVDVAKIKPKRKENLILYVGRFSNLVQNKGQRYLIESFKKLTMDEKYKDWKLVLAGGVEVGVGGYLDELKKEAKGLNVEFLQSPDYQTLLQLYGKAKYFWSAAGYGVDENKNPDKMEHFGITLVEAMAAGVVPIVYSGGGHREIIDDKESGFLFEALSDLVSITKEVDSDYKLFNHATKMAKQKSQVYSYGEFEEKLKDIFKNK